MAQMKKGVDELSEEDKPDPEPVKIDKEWWDRNYLWHYRSPYLTGALMDKLKPYVKKLEKTEAWKSSDEYFRSIGDPPEFLTLEDRWKIAKEWQEREEPEAFWAKQYRDEERKIDEEEEALFMYQKWVGKEDLKFKTSKHQKK